MTIVCSPTSPAWKGAHASGRGQPDLSDRSVRPGQPHRGQPDLSERPVPGEPPALVDDPDLLRRRWESVQVGFVDNPQRAVSEADILVSSAIDEIMSGFSEHRRRLEAAWQKGADASTDELRDAFRLYHSFFERLLAV